MTLAAHLREWVGAWPPPGRGLTVVAVRDRDEPGWDCRARPLLGAVDDSGDGIVAVSPTIHLDVAELLHGEPADVLEDGDLRRRVAEVAVGEGAVLGAGVLRWTTSVAHDIEPIGTWLPHTDPRVPDWLDPFGGEFGTVDEPLDALLETDEDPEIGHAGHGSGNLGSHRVLFLDSVPRVREQLLDAEGKLLVLAIDLEYDRLDLIALLELLAGMLDLLRP